ncbi:hypothetical protein SK128_014560 [Halocaridina rubra]|uniref:Proliferation-associated SNF2-like protein n=1 Tax=Halocaridina rubra TaxID=373956 RepID=A0AAN9A356_HALRR
MHLLSKSEFYSQFLLKQIETQDKENRKSRVRERTKNAVSDKENSSSGESSSQNSNGSNGKGRKREAKTKLGNSSKKLRDGKYKIGDVIDSETVKARGISQAEDVEDIERIEQPRLFENGTMRPYQLDGYSWLTVLFENGVNGILGDEMGLGKTIQCIALICHLVDKGVTGPFLICGPLSTLPNWIAEFKRFAPKIPTILYHGSEKVRAEKRREMTKLNRVEGAPDHVYPVIITSYEVVIRDKHLLNRYQWRYICVDEGHRLKNHQCRLTKCLNTFLTSNRLLLTGTPLQNNLAELWALLNFLMPDIFDSLDVFESWFDISEMMDEDSDEKIVQQEKEKQVIQTLMKILSPFFLRRVKRDVQLDLPPKREMLVYTPMTPQQCQLYEATLQMNTKVFKEMEENSRETQPVEYDSRGRPIRNAKKNADYKLLEEESFDKYLKAVTENVTEDKEPVKKSVKKTAVVNVKLQNKMMQCRRIVNHPYLVHYPLNEDGSYKIDDGLLKTCGKLQVLDQLLAELYKRGHRVLLFSQMTQLMDILEDYLSLRPHYSYKRLDGRLALEDRQMSISEFNSDSSHFLFLLSTRAGGLGINLASADTVIIYDSDWNPQCDLQAQDRCHRIGQTKPVLVLRLITANTIDERIVERAATKRKLEKLIIQSGKFKAARQTDRKLDVVMDTEELTALLKARDHERIHRTETGSVFTKKELNQLLDRSNLENHSESNTKQLCGVFKVLDVNA